MTKSGVGTTSLDPRQIATVRREVERAIKRRVQGEALARVAEDAATQIVAMTPAARAPSAPHAKATQRTPAAYLRLVRRMLEAVRGGISRDEFLRNIFHELGQDSNDDRVVFVLSAYRDAAGETLSGLTMPYVASGNPSRVGAFRDSLDESAPSSLYFSLLGRRFSFELDQLSVLAAFTDDASDRYRGEFDVLIGKGEAWLCALPLPPSEPGLPERSLIAIYKAGRSPSGPTIPAGAPQEWDILQLVQSIYNLLQTQVRSLQDQIASEQRQIIADIAPSAITHELGTRLSLVMLSIGRMPAFIRAIAAKLPAGDADALEVARELVTTRQLVESARRTTEAFTNLQRRNPKSRVTVAALVDEMEIVLSTRLARARVEIVRGEGLDVEIVTDARFVEHVLMNVVMNAIEAMEPPFYDTEPPTSAAIDAGAQEGPTPNEPLHQIAIEAVRRGEKVDIRIANDGPPIPVSVATRVFEQGITSKPLGQGHGQGLYLCRQIATHLGGSFGFGLPPAALPGANVTFSLTIPITSTFETDA